ncbi:MAG TPA: hypothetical protein DCM08_06090 [Microscillaceae bacterium]|nr:hypothetical protein [Microscillaceae bacterium]
MELIIVNNPTTEKAFIQLPVRLYKNDPNWIRPLDQDIQAVFDPQKNPTFQYGECIRWVLQDQGRVVGRVAAFFDRRITEKDNLQPTGGMGFFECEQNKTYAFALMDACRDWLQAKGMEAMDGPVNFGDRSRWWGLLVEGFAEPNYCSNYNPPYYQQFFEEYGFQNYFEQYTYHVVIRETQLSDIFYEKAQRLLKNGSYSFKHISKQNLAQHFSDFREVYNKSWDKHAGVAEMSEEEMTQVMNQLKPVIDERLVWFAYYQNQPIAFMVMIPELNQLFKYVNGKLDAWGIVKFLFHRWRGSCKKVLGMVIGVLPRFHGRGVESAMIAEFSHLAYDKKFPYREMEFNWVGDFLPAMSHVYESIGCTVSKKQITYRKLFDPTKPFQRHPVIK